MTAPQPFLQPNGSCACCARTNGHAKGCPQQPVALPGDGHVDHCELHETVGVVLGWLIGSAVFAGAVTLLIFVSGGPK